MGRDKAGDARDLCTYFASDLHEYSLSEKLSLKAVGASE